MFFHETPSVSSFFGETWCGKKSSPRRICMQNLGRIQAKVIKNTYLSSKNAVFSSENKYFFIQQSLKSNQNSLRSSWQKRNLAFFTYKHFFLLSTLKHHIKDSGFGPKKRGNFFSADDFEAVEYSMTMKFFFFEVFSK